MPDFGWITTTFVPSNWRPAVDQALSRSARPRSPAPRRSGRDRRRARTGPGPAGSDATSRRLSWLIGLWLRPASRAARTLASAFDGQPERSGVDREVRLARRARDRRALEAGRALLDRGERLFLGHPARVDVADLDPSEHVTALDDALGQRKGDDEQECARDAEQDESGPVVVPGASQRRATRGSSGGSGANPGAPRKEDSRRSRGAKLPGDRPYLPVRRNLTLGRARVRSARPAPGGAQWPSRAHPAAPRTCAT